MGDYIKECLKPILGDDVSDDIVEYILTIKHVEDYEEFMENIVDVSNAAHRKAYEALKLHQFGSPKPQTSKKYKGTNIPFQTLNNISVVPNSGQSSGKGKKKYTNFYAQDHRPGLIKGRHPCDCQATKHNLINNCTKCGRIVCEQEGSGPCFFCDNMVCTRYEMDILNANTRESDKLYNHLIEKKKSKEWGKAIEMRNRLIKTDQMGDLIKNKVYDDQNDYFDINSKWSSEDENVKLKKKHASLYSSMHRSRRDMKVALDFASRTAVLDDDDYRKNKKNLMIGLNKLLDSTEKRFPKNLFEGDKGQLIADIVKLMDDTTVSEVKTSEKVTSENKSTKASKYRIANNEFLESVDQGMCLSMHQPWASLLVAGIKIHEGRMWKTDHRGRLWIAAAAKQPEDEEILACEEMYRIFYNDSTLEFPKKYPTGCLLGCVFVEDCLDQGEYRHRYPDGESNSPFVLICSNPVILPVFYPMQGQHKIFSLPKELHRIAKTALLSSKWV
ncbi:ASCH domain [Popillia japonica]|uniref:ASCH domain n=1 Tax=Popillia japonica TaxID=7064 RepID=A0AAW1K3I9_POPJA